MDKRKAEQAVIFTFIGADKRDWELVRTCFADEVLLDYTSMNGGEPVQTSPEEIINSWKALLPGFKATHHMLGNFITEIENDKAVIFCYGTATHYLPTVDNQNVWTVAGEYVFELTRQEEWKITRMRFNFKYMDGNLELPALARKNITAA